KGFLPQTRHIDHEAIPQVDELLPESIQFGSRHRILTQPVKSWFSEPVRFRDYATGWLDLTAELCASLVPNMGGWCRAAGGGWRAGGPELPVLAGMPAVRVESTFRLCRRGRLAGASAYRSAPQWRYSGRPAGRGVRRP